MRLFIKQKVFSMKDRFYIKDEFEQDRFYVEGEFFSLGKKLHIYDMSGNEVAFVQQKLFKLMPRFVVYQKGIEKAEIAKRFSFFMAHYDILGTDWEVDGDIGSHNYSISSNGIHIANISKAWFSWGDSFELNISDDTDQVLAIAVILAIDAVMDASSNNH